MKLRFAVLGCTASAFFGIPQFAGIGLGGPLPMSNSNSCGSFTSAELAALTCAMCERVGAACMEDEEIDSCEKIGFNSIMNRCPEKLKPVPAKKPVVKPAGKKPGKKPTGKKPKKPKAPKKCPAEPSTCDECNGIAGRCLNKMGKRQFCRDICKPKCENPPTTCATCKTMMQSGDVCKKDKSVRQSCKATCQELKKNKGKKGKLVNPL